MSQDVPKQSIWAIKIGLPKARAIMQAILSGADVNETTENDCTVLMFADQNGAVENVVCLNCAGADRVAE